MAKPRKPSPQPRSPRKGRIEPVDLAKAVRDHGVREEGIPETLAVTRLVSDAQAGDAATPVAPMPPEPGSVAERQLDEARQEILQLKKAMELSQARLINAGKATRLNGQREMLWKLETATIRGLPRPSQVGRAMHDLRAFQEKKGVDYSDVYGRLADVVPSPLPTNLNRHVETLRDSSVPREKSTTATSALSRHFGARRKTLVERLGYAQWKKTGSTSRSWLTALGKKLFKGWPDWGS